MIDFNRLRPKRKMDGDINKLRNWPFLLPCLFVLMLCAGWPLIRTIFLGFTDATLENLHDADFIGISNYIDLCRDHDWWKAVYNTFIIAFVSVPLETILGLIIAMILRSHFKGKGFMRVVVLIPWTIPTIVSARMWAWMLNDVYGIINDLLMRASIIDSPIPILFNFPLNKEVATAVVKNLYPNEGGVVVTAKVDTEVGFRYYDYMGAKEDIKFTVNGEEVEATLDGNVFVVAAKAGDVVAYSHAIENVTKPEFVCDREYEVIWRGPDVVDILPHGEHMRLFQRDLNVPIDEPSPEDVVFTGAANYGPTQQKR